MAAPNWYRNHHPLHHAIDTNNMARVREIINQNPNAISRRGWNGSLPISYALRARKQAIVNYLWNKVPRNHLRQLLWHAAMSNNMTVLKRIFNAGISPNTLNATTPVLVSVARQGRQNVLNEFLKRGPSQAILNQALQEAMTHGHAASVRKLILHGARVTQNMRTRYGYTTYPAVRNATEQAVANRRAGNTFAIAGLSNRGYRVRTRTGSRAPTLPKELIIRIMRPRNGN